ncbi:chemotaxis protein CheA [Erythrobacter sp. HL-111]|uniref:chemotaxis protein CheA n=1 Tax=Erythrobacter sp. HL-111 TaxID=1798193 RepID=UPI0006DA0F02|nr:chemotaxis protein CheA [Erythrobacter sp. HL-111]KPP88943.1 MAG: two-component system, chemotaxis family, sensor kinase CheA [Erythrobacteraceae bacterium HL-111]SDT04181.1 two-component system, chemotaxis family, sensor kinase CheA [Erythrobacter sp. HL-111]
MDDLLADFVAETREMLEASEGEIIAWEADPADRARLDAIFRFVHTVKGNCGFFDFPRLAELSHAAEDALADCRAGRRVADSALVSAVLAIIDRIAAMVDAIEAGEDFPEGGDEALIAALAEEPEIEIDAREEAAPAGAADPAEEDGAAERSETRSASAHTATQRSIRLPVELLDRVMSGVSDMVLARNDLAHRLRQAGNQPTIDGPFERLTTILSDVRDAITRMRMQRIETLFASLPRLVRDLSGELGKQVMIDLEGGDVELDREMIEVVRDPLTHIIRNAIDHGVEPPSDRLAAGKREIALLSIAARQSGNTISIVVSDDGRGLDEARIATKAVATGLISEAERREMGRDKILQLIFEPGFSTAEKVTGVSGRGVGLDVVRQNLERVGGSIKVSSQPGVGTLFTLQIPLTLSIIAGLTVETGEQRFAIPQSYVEEIVHSSAKALDYTRMGETALITFRGQRVPCLLASDVLGLDCGDIAEGDHTMVMLRLASGDLFALAVDRIHSHGDLVVKPLAPAVMKSGYYAGSTLLDDGRPVLLLDVTNIAAMHHFVSDARTRVLKGTPDNAGRGANEAMRAMLFTDFAGRRSGIRLELVKRIETAPASAVDRSTGRARAVIDGVILPLVGLPDGPLPADKVRLLRLSDGACELLHAVAEVDDAVELTEPLIPVADDPLIEAVTLVAGRTVTLIDGHDLFARHGEPPEPAARPLARLPESEWARTILAPLVVSAGYEIAEPNSGGDEVALTIMFEDVYEVAAALDRPVAGPVLRLSDQPDRGGAETIYRYDRAALVDALHRARNRQNRGDAA